MRFRDHQADELSHYSKGTTDIEYAFPWGWGELCAAAAYRTDFDLTQHSTFSGEDLRYTDPYHPEHKFIPHVIEPSFGVDRTLLALLLSSYKEESVSTSDGKTDLRVVMKFPYALAPIKIAILPLSKKEELISVAHPLALRLAKSYRVEYDETQSIGKRYRRQDEIGTPYCVTVDFDTLNDQAVTVRDRDTMKQERIPLDALETYFLEKYSF